MPTFYFKHNPSQSLTVDLRAQLSPGSAALATALACTESPAGSGYYRFASTVAANVLAIVTDGSGNVMATITATLGGTDAVIDDSVTPDNAAIAAIKTKTDNLPASPASEPNATANTASIITAVGSPLQSGSYVTPPTAADNATATVSAITSTWGPGLNNIQPVYSGTLESVTSNPGISSGGVLSVPVASTGIYRFMSLRVASGAAGNQWYSITGYSTANRSFTIGRDWLTVPTAGDVVEIYPGIAAPVDGGGSVSPPAQFRDVSLSGYIVSANAGRTQLTLSGGSSVSTAYVDQILRIVGGANTAFSTNITAYDATTKTITLAESLPVALSGTVGADRFAIAFAKVLGAPTAADNATAVIAQVERTGGMLAGVAAKTTNLPTDPASETNANSNRLTIINAVSQPNILATTQPNYAPAKAGDQMALTSGTVTAVAGSVDAVLSDNFAAIPSSIDNANATTTTIERTGGLLKATYDRVGLIQIILNGITSLANWLRLLARSGTGDATALGELNTGGGTYATATHSLQAAAVAQAGLGSTIAGEVTTAVVAALTDVTVTISSPIARDGKPLSIMQGDDYRAADGRAITITVTGVPSLSGATATLKLRSSGVLVTAVGVIGSTTSNGTPIVFELTRAQTGTLPPCQVGGERELEIVLANGNHLTVNKGVIIVERQLS